MDKQALVNWYALYTSPRAEKQVEERLKAKGLTCYLPLHRTPRKWSDRIKIVEVPLFNSYIFVQCEEHVLRELFRVYGVVKAVYHDGKPAVIRPKEIEEIKRFLELAQNHELSVGEEVEILLGDLKNCAGKVKTISKKYIGLYLESLDAMVVVKKDIVAPVNRLIK
ncbi:MAG: UpxY family transcription antiterminator [Tannerellaceae bacterium]|nr:UpxY family transcription antiterminator [Tannerellaceae bacterium]